MKKKYYCIIVIIAIAILVISSLFIISYYNSIYFGTPPYTQYEAAKNQACGILMRDGNCSNDIVSTTSILVKDFDVNKDGKIDSKDTLFELCKNYYGLKNDCECKYSCGCIIYCD